jgi:anaerobic C4-dicarboxylate transporter DcuA
LTVAAIAAFASVSALFVLPTYPTLLAAIEFDDTGSTRIGKYVFNHPFLIPGVICITLAVIFGFLLAPLVI